MPRGVRTFRKGFILLLLLQTLLLLLILEFLMRPMDHAAKFGAVTIFLVIAVFEGFIFMREELNLMLKEMPLLARIRTRHFLSRSRSVVLVIVVTMFVVSPMLIMTQMTTPLEHEETITPPVYGEMSFWVLGIPSFRQEVAIELESDRKFDLYVIPYAEVEVIEIPSGIENVFEGFPSNDPVNVVNMVVANVTETWRFGLTSEGSVDLCIVDETTYLHFVTRVGLGGLWNNPDFRDNCTNYWSDTGDVTGFVTLGQGSYRVLLFGDDMVAHTEVVIYRWAGASPVAFGTGTDFDLDKGLYPGRYTIIIISLVDEPSQVHIRSTVFYLRPIGVLIFLISSISLVGYASLYIYARSVSEGLVEQSPYIPDMARGISTEKAVKAKLRKIDKQEFIKYLAEEAAKLKDSGNRLFKQDRYAEALILFERALTIDPDNASFWNNKAIALRALNRYDEATIAYDKAMSLDPTNEKLRAGRDSCLAEISPPDPSEEDILSVEVREPKEKRVKPRTGVPAEPPGPPIEVAEKTTGKRAKPVWEAKVVVEPVSEASVDVVTPPSAAPDEPTTMDGGKAADRKLLAGNYLDAIGMYEKLIGSGRGDVRSWNNLAFAYRQLNDHDNAERCYRETLAIDPEDIKAKKGLAKIGRA